MMHECAKYLCYTGYQNDARNETKTADARYPERMLDLRLVQPRWTTVLLEGGVRHDQTEGGGKQEDLLGKHVDDASSQSLVTNTTDPFFRDGDVACPGPAPPNAFTEDELGLSLHVAGLAQVCHDAGLVEDGIGCAHPAFEVELQFLHGQRRRNQGQGCVCR